MESRYTGRRKEIEYEWHLNLHKFGEGFENVAFIRKAIEEFPEDETFLYRIVCAETFLAEILEESGKLEESLEHYNIAIKAGLSFMEMFPNNENVPQFISRCQKKLN